MPDVVTKQYHDVGSETQAMAKVTLECGLQVQDVSQLNIDFQFSEI